MSDKREVRLIDANALFNAFESVGWFDNADRELAEDLILSAHTIDAVPVVHSYWEDKEMQPNGVVCKWICSACGKNSLKDSSYCPHCGAKMDGGKDDENA